MPTQFECDPLTGVVSGTMDAKTVEHPNIGVDLPSTLIRTDQDWGVEVKWSITGPLVPLLLEEFEMRLYIEDLTPSENEYAIGPLTVATNSGVPDPVVPNTLNYTYTVKIGDGADPAWVPDHARIPAGVYQLTALVQLHNVAPARPWPVAAFETLPIVNVYTPV